MTSKLLKDDPTIKGKVGRPTDFDDEISDHICELITEGHSLKAICRMPTMPNAGTVFRWLAKHKSFSDQYARAKEYQAELEASDIVAISDDDTGDVQRDRLRVDARKWVAAKLLPKKYGERITQEHTGPDGGAIQLAGVSDEDLEQLRSLILKVMESET